MEKLYTIREVADYLRISKWTAYRLVHKYNIATKIGSMVRVKERDLQALVKELQDG